MAIPGGVAGTGKVTIEAKEAVLTYDDKKLGNLVPVGATGMATVRRSFFALR